MEQTKLFKRFLKYKDKYSKTERKDFIITSENKISHKGVTFWNFDEVDQIGFNDLNKKEQDDFLNSIWNYYVYMSD